MAAIPKHCVFCGEKPQDKSKEHVVPRWLIELTGKPGRKARFGFSKNLATKEMSERVFAFDQFTFPACSSCNQKYSHLENRAKKSMCSVLSGDDIAVEDLSELLDWFDKVRVGLWLGMRLLDKDLAQVDPNFHIETRLGQFDRLLFVEKSDFPASRLNIVGAETLCFALTPSAFMLIVNGYHFTNVSSMFLCARRLGFPYVTRSRLHPDREETEVEFAAGRKRIMTPILRRATSEKGIRVFQPMFKGGLMQGDTDVYDCEYVDNHSIDASKGIGNVYLESASSVTEYGAGDRINLEPVQVLEDRRQHVLTGIHILEWQLWLHSNLPSMELLTPDQRHFVRHRFGTANRVNRKYIEHYRKML